MSHKPEKQHQAFANKARIKERAETAWNALADATKLGQDKVNWIREWIRKEEREHLCSRAIHWYWESRPARARHCAERLARLLGEPASTKDEIRYAPHWIAIWQARGNSYEAIRIGEMDLETRRAALGEDDTADFASKWVREEIRYLQIALYLQADRYIRVADREHAKERMLEASQLAERYGIELDAQERELLRDLTREREW
jgi:hypothetical protein